ncbi:fatty acyl-CoA reductase wat-like [Plutella xylostella]|uniref:fatty acyl-CoA reductase wat-like n=1 Tax=Plutella xylostella TaxID=51655 RepID=UPI002032DFE7|nr:fatty acyl-CoA reductase wat-like [Plutella xylostella]
MDPAEDVTVLSRLRAIRTAEERGDSRVQRALAGATVFITGGTGFLGKQLIEKLFRSCRDIKKVYLLSRDKKGVAMEDRLKAVLQDPVFDSVRAVNPGFEGRLVPVAGDVQQLRLGLSDDDWNMLAEEVNIIYHAAATVRFEEPIKLAILTNVRGTREMIELAKNTKNLRAFVHVSTAFTNCKKIEVFEKFYPSPVPAQTIIEFVETVDESRLDAITPKLLGDFPNTYSFSKAIAEDAVRTLAADLPACVIRPAIVLPSACEPAPGWVDVGNVFGPSGLLLGFGLGLAHTMLVDPEARNEMVPVDYVNNLTIAATYDTVRRYENGDKDTRIYTLSNIRNMVNWKILKSVLISEGRQLLSPQTMWYCGSVEATNRYSYFFLLLFLHFIPAVLADVVFKVTGSSFRLTQIYTKMYKLQTTLRYFHVSKFLFHDDHTMELFNSLSDTDKKIFFFDMAELNFYVFIRYWWLGIRKYILKDGLKGTEEAVNRQKWFRIASYVLFALYAYGIFKLGVFLLSVLSVGLSFVCRNLSQC